jgi:hypothetical protein
LAVEQLAILREGRSRTRADRRGSLGAILNTDKPHPLSAAADKGWATLRSKAAPPAVLQHAQRSLRRIKRTAGVIVRGVGDRVRLTRAVIEIVDSVAAGLDKTRHRAVEVVRDRS